MWHTNRWQGVWIFLQIYVASWLRITGEGTSATWGKGSPSGCLAWSVKWKTIGKWWFIWWFIWNSRELPWNWKKRWSRGHTIAASQVSCCLEVFNRLWKWGVSLSQVQDGTCAWLCCDCSIQRVSYQIYRPVWHTNQSFCCTCSPTEELHVIWTMHIYAYLKYFLWYCHLPSNSRQPVRAGPFLRSTMGCGGSVGKAVSIDSLEAGKRAKWEGPWVVAPPNSQTNSDEFCWMSHTPFWECERNQQC